MVAYPLRRHTAEMTAFLLSLIGLTPSVSGVIVSASGFSVQIVSECTAVFVAILFFSFVIAYPTTFKHKFIGLLFGLPVLVGANLLRVVFIFLVGLNFRAMFEYAHVYIGQILMVLLVLLISMLWLRSTVSVAMADRPRQFLTRFIAYSSIPFAIWLYIDKAFVYANLYLVKWLLGIFGLQVAIPQELSLYPHTFNTFHLIAFAALILATRSIDRAKKARSLMLGLAILCAAHFLFRLCYALFVDVHFKYAMQPFIALIIINQWILPFALWLYMVRNELFRRSNRFICPICGEEKTGLAEHMLAKHGVTLSERARLNAEKVA